MARKRHGAEETITKIREAELLNREIFDTLREAQVLIETWRREYNHVRPHSSLGYGPPAPIAAIPRSTDKGKSIEILS